MAELTPSHRVSASCDCQSCSDVKGLARELTTAQRELAALRAERDALKADADASCACRHDGRGGLTSECQEHREIREERDALKAQVETLRQERDSLRDDLQTNAAMLARQCDLAREAETARDRLAAEVERQKQRIAELKVEKEQLDKKVNELTRPMSDAEYHDRAPGGWMDEAKALEAEVERLRLALRKVRAHTTYTVPRVGTLADLLAGLLASIERITNAALAEAPTPAREEGGQ